ncbi:MAG: MFS transporter [Planctomycetes bacterium]|nr:MFS transporter [Planctomycetota bacterium]
MLTRFCLYGFLKNQVYFEPFWILAFREKGLSFFWIGLLFGFRGVCINLFELPAGAMADLYGRRNSLLISWCGYMVAFLIFAINAQIGLMFLAMAFYAIGEVFRTGTHKSIILEWLRKEDRLDQKTKIYGYTRSWSKKGSALSVIIAAILLYCTGDYSVLFYATIIPYILGMVNIFGYPTDIGREKSEAVSVREVWRHLMDTLKDSWNRRELRALMAEAMAFQGLFKTTESYLQPGIQLVATTLAAYAVISGEAALALLVAGVYFVLYMVSSFSAKNAHIVAERFGDEDKAARYIWTGYFLLFVAIFIFFYMEMNALAVVFFMVAHILQNIWRPMIVTRISKAIEEERMTTMLSLESQSKALFVAIFSPLLGWLVDTYGLYMVGVLGSFTVLLIFPLHYIQNQAIPSNNIDKKA